MPHYNLAHTWHQDNSATHVIALLLLSMSILSWSVIIIKGCDLWRITRLAKQAQKIDLPSLLLKEKRKPFNTINTNPFLALAYAAQVAFDHYQNQPHKQQHPDLSEWLIRCLTQVRNDSVLQLQRGLRILSLIGLSAPFIGLFGTVIGISQDLFAPGTNRFTALEQFTWPLGEALMLTAGGLFVAIPAVLAYKLFTSTDKVIINKLNRYAQRLHVYFVVSRRPIPIS